MVERQTLRPVRRGTEAQGTRCREGEAGHDVSLEGNMGETSSSQTVYTEPQWSAKDTMGCIVMRQSGVNALITEEPDERIVHVRICGGAGRATAGSTRMQEGYRSMGRGVGKFQGARKRAGS